MLSDGIFRRRPRRRIDRIRSRGEDFVDDVGHALVRVERDAVDVIRNRPFETAGLLLIGLGIALIVVGVRDDD